MTFVSETEEFSLLGGPLHRLGARLGLVRGGTNTVALGLALGWVPWLFLVLLALAEGGATKIFTLPVVAVHARLLLAVPLLFVAETALDAKFREFVTLLVRSGVAGQRALPELEAAAARLQRWKDSWLPDAASLLAAAALSLLWARIRLSGQGAHETSQELAAMPLAAAWYWFVCLPLFRFLMVRWGWRLAFWWVLLRRLSRMDLELAPAHPDGVGGLGYLEIVHTRFAALALAISTYRLGDFRRGYRFRQKQSQRCLSSALRDAAYRFPAVRRAAMRLRLQAEGVPGERAARLYGAFLPLCEVPSSGNGSGMRARRSRCSERPICNRSRILRTASR